MAAHKSTALKNHYKKINVSTPSGPVKSFRKAKRAPLTVAELRARDTTRNYGTAIKCTPSGKVY